MSTFQEQNPFKGLHSYREKDKDSFYGRDREAKELFKLVKLNMLTVVFGKSGIGKTSLIHAGLFPRLRESHFLPVPIRLDYTSLSQPLLFQVIQRIQEELADHKIREMEKGREAETDSFREGETLWEYFHRVEHVDRDGQQIIPVLLFDQFEEFFTTGKNHTGRETLVEELYYLIEDQVPYSLRERFIEDGEMYPYINTQVAVRVVLGLRENYLPQLNSLKQQIPSIDRVLFRVLHLNGRQAREVISMPGGFEDKRTQEDILRQFGPEDMDPAKKIPEEELEKMEVEPSLLSLLCYQMFEKGITSLSGQDKDMIFLTFYEEVLEKLPRSEEVAEFIENRLLTEDGFRTPTYLDRGHRLREAVEEAINRRILRKFHIGEKEHVEIIHDALVPVIKERRDRRLEEKKRLELQKEFQQKQIIFRITAIAGIVAIFLAVFAFIQKTRADRQRVEALCNRLATESTLVLPANNIKAIRIAEAAYKMRISLPLPYAQRALCEAAYSTFEHPFYVANLKHKSRVISAVFSPDGTKILTVSSDHTAKLWDSKGILLVDLNKHTDDVNSAAFSPNGTKIITASDDHTAKLWNLSGKLLANLDMHTDDVFHAVFSPDGTKILTASKDHTAKLWDSDGKLLADLNKHTARLGGAIFSPDGSKILTLSWDNTAKLWNLHGNLLADLNRHDDYVSSAVFSPDGSKIATASWDNTAKLWDLNGRLLADLKHTNYVWKAAFSPDGTKIVTASSDRTAKLWDLKGKLLADLKHSDKVWGAIFSLDGTKILTRSEDAVKLWDLGGNLLADLNQNEGEVGGAMFSPDGSKIFTWSGNTVKLWDLNGNLLSELKHTNYVSSAVSSLDGKTILTCSGNSAKLWNAEGNFLTDLKNFKNGFNNAAISPDGSKILDWSGNTARLWDLNGNLLAELNKHTAPILDTAFPPDGNRILTASWDSTAILWDLNGELLADMKHTSQVNSAVFSTDGSKILTVSRDNRVILWDLKGHILADLSKNMEIVDRAILSPDGGKILTWSGPSAKLRDLDGNLLASLDQHTDDITSAAFSPDGKRIITTSKDHTAKLWNVRGKLLVDFRKHTDEVLKAVFSGDGGRILTASEDGTAKLWDLEGNLLADLNRHGDDVLDAAFSSDGSRMITVSKDGTVKSWYTPEAIIQWLKTAPIPKLHEKEKEELGID
jgi:WD40 repeat protein